MKIITREEFLKMPAGTVYRKFEPTIFGDLCVKGDTCGKNDWFYFDLAGDLDDETDDGTCGFVTACDRMAGKGESVDVIHDSWSRDGLFEAEDETWFAVYEKKDLYRVWTLVGSLLKGEVPQ